MENLKSLADQIRDELKNPATAKPKATATQLTRSKGKSPPSGLLGELDAFNTSGHKSMVHVRFDEKTARLMNQFKMATGTDVSKLVSFAVKKLVDATPEIRQLIKNFIQNSEL